MTINNCTKRPEPAMSDILCTSVRLSDSSIPSTQHRCRQQHQKQSTVDIQNTQGYPPSCAIPVAAYMDLPHKAMVNACIIHSNHVCFASMPPQPLLLQQRHVARLSCRKILSYQPTLLLTIINDHIINHLLSCLRQHIKDGCLVDHHNDRQSALLAEASGFFKPIEKVFGQHDTGNKVHMHVVRMNLTFLAGFQKKKSDAYTLACTVRFIAFLKS